MDFMNLGSDGFEIVGSALLFSFFMFFTFDR